MVPYHMCLYLELSGSLESIPKSKPHPRPMKSHARDIGINSLKVPRWFQYTNRFENHHLNQLVLRQTFLFIFLISVNKGYLMPSWKVLNLPTISPAYLSLLYQIPKYISSVYSYPWPLKLRLKNIFTYES